MKIGILYFLEEENLEKLVRWVSLHGDWRILNPSQEENSSLDLLIFPASTPRREFLTIFECWEKKAKKILALGEAATSMITALGGGVKYPLTKPNGNRYFSLGGNHTDFHNINCCMGGYHCTGYAHSYSQIEKLPQGFVGLAYQTRLSRDKFIQKGKITKENPQVFSDLGKYWGIKHLPYMVNNNPGSLVYDESGYEIGDQLSNEIMKKLINNQKHEGDSHYPILIPG